MLVFILLIPLVILCARVAAKSDRFRYLLFLSLMLSLIAGFREESVGIDTINYINKLIMISNGSPEFAFGLEPGFKILAKYILMINSSPTFFFIIAALLTNTLILKRLWDFRYVASVPCMCFCYYACFYGYTFNIMRQFMAIAVLFYSSRLLEKKRYVPFILIVLLCTYFLHKSSIICLGFVAIDLILWNHLSKLQKTFIGTGLIVLPIAFSYIVSALYMKYAVYFENMSSNIGIMIFAKMLFFIISIFIERGTLLPKLSPERIASNYSEYRMRIATVLCYAMGLLLACIGYFFNFMDRIGLYYLIYECVFFGMLINNNFNKSFVNIKKHSRTKVKNNSLVFLAMILILIAYSFTKDLMNNSQGIIPYTSVLF